MLTLSQTESQKRREKERAKKAGKADDNTVLSETTEPALSKEDEAEKMASLLLEVCQLFNF